MTNFVIIPADDPLAPLKNAFPEIWSDLLEYADPDTPHLMYSGFAELLLVRRADADLWARAYRLFNEIADGTNKSAQEALLAARV